MINNHKKQGVNAPLAFSQDYSISYLTFPLREIKKTN